MVFPVFPSLGVTAVQRIVCWRLIIHHWVSSAQMKEQWRRGVRYHFGKQQGDWWVIDVGLTWKWLRSSEKHWQGSQSNGLYLSTMMMSVYRFVSMMSLYQQSLSLNFDMLNVNLHSDANSDLGYQLLHFFCPAAFSFSIFTHILWILCLAFVFHHETFCDVWSKMIQRAVV